MVNKLEILKNRANNRFKGQYKSSSNSNKYLQLPQGANFFKPELGKNQQLGFFKTLTIFCPALAFIITLVAFTADLGAFEGGGDNTPFDFEGQNLENVGAIHAQDIVSRKPVVDVRAFGTSGSDTILVFILYLL